MFSNPNLAKAICNGLPIRKSGDCEICLDDKFAQLRAESLMDSRQSRIGFLKFIAVIKSIGMRCI